MTRREYAKIVKNCFIGLLVSIPIILILDFLVKDYISTFVMVVANVIILVVAGVVCFFISEKKQESIEKKKQNLQSKSNK